MIINTNLTLNKFIKDDLSKFKSISSIKKDIEILNKEKEEKEKKEFIETIPKRIKEIARLHLLKANTARFGISDNYAMNRSLAYNDIQAGLEYTAINTNELIEALDNRIYKEDRFQIKMTQQSNNTRYFGDLSSYNISQVNRTSPYLQEKTQVLNNFQIRNLNSYAKENTINTNFGKAEVFLDLYDDNDKLGIGKIDSNEQLFNFDSNRNGKIEAGDKYFDKLKIRAYDKDGNEIIKKLSEVVSYIDLKDFIKDKKEIQEKILEEKSSYDQNQTTEDFRLSNIINPYSYFKEEYRYDKMEKNEIQAMFNNYADKDGWIDLRQSGIFNKNGKYLNFAYEKIGFNGEVQLSEFNLFYQNATKDSDINLFNKTEDGLTLKSYSELQKSKIDLLYNDYMKVKQKTQDYIKHLQGELNKHDLQEYSDKFNNYKSNTMLQIERIFEKVTNLDFSIENLNKVKNSFNQNLDKAAASLQDTDAVVAMKLNENGTITLKFNSGRELNVRSLYSDSGGLLDDGNVALNLKAKTMNEEELNKLDLSVTAIKVTNEKTKEDEFVSLKDLGVKIIKKLNSRFEILTHNNKFYSVDNLYMMFKFEDIKPKDKDELFYPKPFDVRV